MRQIFGVVFVALATVLSVPDAAAEAPWLKDSDSCANVETRLDAFQMQIRSDEKMTDRQRGELAVLLHEACGPRFSRCKLAICETLAVRIKDPGARSERPLNWLNRDLDCPTLLQEVRTRYSTLGKLIDLPDSKRVEVGYVLDIVCSERFAHCKLKQCAADHEPKSVPSAGASSGPASPAEAEPFEVKIADRLAMEAERLAAQQIDARVEAEPAQISATPPVPAAIGAADTEPAPPSETAEDRAVQLALAEYERLVRDEAANRHAMIEMAVELEKKERKVWNRIGNPEELAVVEERRKRAKQNAKSRGGEDEDTAYYSDFFDKEKGAKSKPTNKTSSSRLPKKPAKKPGGGNRSAAQKEPIVF